MNNEIWKPIPGWEGYYSVSNKGRIKSEERIINEKRPSNWKPKQYKISEKILNPRLMKEGKGYWRVSLSKESKIKYIYIHRAVAWAFIGQQKKGTEVRHLNGDSQDNRLENLAYGTKSDNIKDAKKHGTFPVLEKRPGAKLTQKEAKEIALSQLSLKDLASKYNVSSGVIRQIKTGETWESVTREERKQNPYTFKRRKA
jgi:NUMOD4 motif/HNH endonuclease